jgi:DNA-binding CsgD family transcriptional regulator/tetratricopeptide (TPR) repeat protein
MSAREPRPLFGRKDECRLLDELLAAVRAGESRALVIAGESGVGKTALLEYALGAAADFRFERAVGVESEMELAFAALHQLCAPLLDGLDRLDRLPEPQCEALATALGLRPGPAPDRFLVGLAVLGLLSEASADRPLLCVIDDAQWVDPASAQTLAFVARRLSAEPVGVLFATRHPCEELTLLRSLELDGLDGAAARQLLLSAISSPLDEGVRERIIAETRGNPLALLDLPRGLTATRLAGGFGLIEPHAPNGDMEETIARRLGAVSDETRRLLLVASAEPVGDPLLLLRACERLGVSVSALNFEAGGLLVLGERVTFRDPLVRSAVYRSAAVQERRAIHRALADMTDREVDPDRRAWHLAAAAAGPDETVASELERSADLAQTRGGVGAAAAFFRRAVELSLDPAKQVERALAAAQASLHAGAFDVALGLVATAGARALGDFERARLDLVRARIAFATSRGAEASASLLRAVKRIEGFDTRLARASYPEALSAAIFAGSLARPGGGVREVADAVRAAKCPGDAGRASDLLLDGWAASFDVGSAMAVTTLQDALRRFAEGSVGPDRLHLLWLAATTAAVVWDDAAWEGLSGRHVELARSSGTLSELPLALNSRSYIHLFRGELEAASALIEEARETTQATKASPTSWGAIALAVLRGRLQDASAMLDVATADAAERGDGISLTVVAWARALLYNGLGLYDSAFAAAIEAFECPTNSAPAAWGMVELIEAAARAGETDTAAEAAARFDVIARASGTDWVLGVNARSRALLSANATAERLYRESLDRLERCHMCVDLARARLLYGEWLRREGRRVDARAQLRGAYDDFTSIGIEAFAERARRELLATGETARKRTVETRDDLTPQERHVAALARDGLSNPEIGARLFLSRRTVEWHLRKVFAKLEIRSRRELAAALPSEAELLSA